MTIASSPSPLDIIVERLGSVRVDRRGEHHAECPFCGKAVRRDQHHFSYSERGYKCFVCGAKGGLAQLAAHLGVGTRQGVTPTLVRRPAPDTPRYPWQDAADELVATYATHPDTHLRWFIYKCVPKHVVDKFRLGVGRLPSSSCRYDRLIVPVYAGGRCVGLHGRAFDKADDGPKWLCSAGTSKSHLVNADLLTPRCGVVIVENLVDAMLLMDINPDIVAVASGGAAWGPSHTRAIVNARPRAVLVWMDNDDAGRRAAADIVAALRRADVPSNSYQWGADAPEKADVGWWVEEWNITQDVNRVMAYRASQGRH